MKDATDTTHEEGNDSQDIHKYPLSKGGPHTTTQPRGLPWTYPAAHLMAH